MSSNSFGIRPFCPKSSFLRGVICRSSWANAAFCKLNSSHWCSLGDINGDRTWITHTQDGTKRNNQESTNYKTEIQPLGNYFLHPYVTQPFQHWVSLRQDKNYKPSTGLMLRWATVLLLTPCCSCPLSPPALPTHVGSSGPFVSYASFSIVSFICQKWLRLLDAFFLYNKGARGRKT